ncbi:hypothetical protein RB195_001099 [Necator americanus]|uniref:Uncharacterized protein n=1 Tax=Necator americanus TaxID=51031 RepID=A0ABR1DCP6_NECAM
MTALGDDPTTQTSGANPIWKHRSTEVSGDYDRRLRDVAIPTDPQCLTTQWDPGTAKGALGRLLSNRLFRTWRRQNKTGKEN